MQLYLRSCLFPGVLTTCLADMTVQMKIPTETKAIDRYLLAEYLQEKKGLMFYQTG